VAIHGHLLLWLPHCNPTNAHGWLESQ